jgi:peptidoglycan/xylan/chitin deacetylase (PgdA/CDA1 family)
MLTVPILYYHLIKPVPADAPNASIYVEPHRFARQLGLLKLLGYRGIGFDEFMDHLEAGTKPVGRRRRSDRTVMITFDDGHEDNFTQALPILKEHGFSATIFVVAGHVGRSLRLRSSAGPEGERILSRDQIRELVREGMDVQSHGMTHANLADLPADKAEEEIRRSKEILEDITEKPVRYFAFPYGSFRPAHLDMVAQAGYRAAVSTVRGKTHSLDERFCLKRIPVHHDLSLPRLVNVLWFKSYRRAQAQLDLQRGGKVA